MKSYQFKLSNSKCFHRKYKNILRTHIQQSYEIAWKTSFEAKCISLQGDYSISMHSISAGGGGGKTGRSSAGGAASASAAGFGAGV